MAETMGASLTPIYGVVPRGTDYQEVSTETKSEQATALRAVYQRCTPLFYEETALALSMPPGSLRI